MISQVSLYSDRWQVNIDPKRVICLEHRIPEHHLSLEIRRCSPKSLKLSFIRGLPVSDGVVYSLIACHIAGIIPRDDKTPNQAAHIILFPHLHYKSFKSQSLGGIQGEL